MVTRCVGSATSPANRTNKRGILPKRAPRVVRVVTLASQTQYGMRIRFEGASMSTGDMPAYPGLPTEMELDRAARASEERNSRLSRAADRISAMEFTAEVNSGSVRATVDAAGSLQRI